MKKALKYFPLVTAVLALAALIVGLAAPAVVYQGEWLGKELDPVYYSGWKSVFGYTAESSVDLGGLGSLENSTKVLSFSFWNLLTYILLILGIGACVVAFIKPEFSWLGYAAAGCFVGATVLFFCACSATAFTQFDDKEIAEYLSLGAGAIVGAILSILAVLCAAAPPVLALLQKKKIIKLK